MRLCAFDFSIETVSFHVKTQVLGWQKAPAHRAAAKPLQPCIWEARQFRVAPQRSCTRVLLLGGLALPCRGFALLGV